ncbi:hypothetical protein P3X46_031118 [Hevea brasiliensis]|uniref:Alpha/beta hydrolase fold-3 domain-containing protein n=1 Tax=Hevea brasiliensis TaxID=3981 RepID=A0ABQ9KKF9_HEVBR|nr:probable carboxylesterase 17 [Hevea brasiliensis]KAJ9140472.1 hypothetical protein P3X46_031118 [Hevea brasiliensis]
MSLFAEMPGYLQVFSDGSVKRFAPETVPASMKSTNGYKFKDVVIDESKPITARLFIPESSASQLPVMVYFHGGGFCIGSTTWLGYHQFLRDLSVTSQAIVLSIDYRLAPENRLPIAYDDCYSSLEWLSHQVGVEPWLKLADLSRVFLSGDSAGGNIAHHVAVRAMRNEVSNVKIKGLLLIHPYFGSEKRTEKEMADEADEEIIKNDMFWRLSIPEGSNLDYFGCNFQIQDLSEAEWSVFPATMVQVASLDCLNERGIMYAEFLAKQGVKEVELVEAEGESHVFHVLHPESHATRLLQQQMTKFMNSITH